MTHGSFTVDQIAKGFGLSISKVHTVVRELFPFTSERGRQTVLNGEQAGRVISHLAGDRSIKGAEWRTLKKILMKVDWICDSLEEMTGDALIEEAEPEDFPDDEDRTAEEIANRQILMDLKMPRETHVDTSGFIDTKPKPGERITGKQFCMITGSENVDRQELGVFASRVARANNIPGERRTVEGLTHPVSTWPIEVWELALTLYNSDTASIEEMVR